MLTNAKSVHKIEAILKRALRFMLNDYQGSYEDSLKKSGNPGMSLRRTSSLCIEIYKTINYLNPEVRKTNGAQREKSNEVSFGTKGLRIQGTRVWNALPFYIKSKENLWAFKYVTKFWDGSKCSCCNVFP